MAQRLFGAQQGRRHQRHHHGQVTRRAGTNLTYRTYVHPWRSLAVGQRYTRRRHQAYRNKKEQHWLARLTRNGRSSSQLRRSLFVYAALRRSRLGQCHRSLGRRLCCVLLTQNRRHSRSNMRRRHQSSFTQKRHEIEPFTALSRVVSEIFIVERQ